MSVVEYLTHFFEGNARSVKAKKNITAMFLLKGVSAVVSFMLVPVMIGYLGTVDYGIWITLGSIISWLNFFDVGLGNGMRNKFAEALAKGDGVLARVYVSTTYAMLSLIVGALLILSLLIIPFVNWTAVFNAPPQSGAQLGLLVTFVVIFFLIKFLFGLIGTMLVADQRPAMQSLMDAIASILSLIAVFILSRTTVHSLLYLGIAVSLSAAVVPVAASLFFFRSGYRAYVPSIRYVKLEHARELTSLGFQFFFIQVAVIVIFLSSNLIITQLFGPAQVTVYNVVFKYFNIVTMVSSIVNAPFWSAHTEAYQNGDTGWIRNAVQRLTRIWYLLVVCVIAMIGFSNWFYRIWVGNAVEVPVMLSVAMGAFVVVSAWNNIFVGFINGVGRIRLQLYSAAIGAIINIPLAIFLAKYVGLGVSGVVIAASISLIGGTVINPIQYRKIIGGTATGVWYR